MADKTIIDTMARAMYLHDATRTIMARGGSAVVAPEWYDEYAAMPVTGKGFVEEWEGHARAALRSLLYAGPTIDLRAAIIAALEEADNVR